MALITLEDLTNLSEGIYSPKDIADLNIYKRKIENILHKYLPDEGQSSAASYELPNEISNDLMAVHTYLAIMSPIVGSIKGTMIKLEEDKKFFMSVKFNSGVGSIEVKKNLSREQAKDVIQAYSRMCIAFESYKNFQYTVADWIETMRSRLKILGAELKREGHMS